jgi:signal transduction histidine kinase
MRPEHGFTLNQLITEYRALRAIIVRRWRAEIGQAGADELEELSRFNEAIDDSLSEAVDWYNARAEDARVLLNGVLAHDLRSPLGAILMSAETLLHDETLNHRWMRAAVRIRNSGTRIERMVNDLLDFTRTRLGTGLPIDLAENDMERIVQQVVEEQRAFHPDASIDCETSGELTGCWDSARIEQLLGNLIANAVEHGGSSPVTVTAEELNGEIAVRIHNENGFIPEQEQNVIFDPLRRAAVRHREHERRDTGLGLGLYIACQIAEAHGGAIEVDSSPEEGTTFEVRLPREHHKGAATAGMT